MPLTPQEELELLQLEEEEYQHSLKNTSPAKQQEKAKDKEPESTSMQAALSGAAQGLTFGFSDELGAAADVAADYLTNKPVDNIADRWRQYQKEREAVNLKQEEEHPWAYTGGNIAGSIAPALIPGLGVAGEAMTLGKAAKAGAVYGGLSSLGTSKADVSNIKELGKDVATGTAAGAITGGLLHGIVNKIPDAGHDLTKQMTSDNDYLSKLGLSYRLGQRGVTPTTTRGKNVTAYMGQTHEPSKVASSILRADAEMAKPLEQMLTIHEGPIQLDPNTTKELIQSIKETPTLKKYLFKNAPEMLYEINETGTIDPMDAWKLKRALYNFSEDLSSRASSDLAAGAASKEARQFANELNDALKKQVAGYENASNQFQSWRENVIDVILNPGKKPDAREVFLGDLKNKTGGLTDAVENIFGTAHLPGASSASAERSAMYQLEKGLSRLEQEAPDALKHLGFESAEEGASKFKDLANKLSLLKQFQGHEPHEGLKRTAIGQIVGSGEGLTYNIANRLGQMQKAITSVPGKLSSSVFKMSPEKVQNVAIKLKENPSLQHLGNKLEQAMGSKDPYLKNAVLFQVLQDPHARDYLKDSLLE